VTSLTLDTRIVRLPDLIASEMDGDLVMMSIERGEYYGISGVGTRIWELVEQPASLAQIASTIHAEFDIDAPSCERDVLQFVGEMLTRGVVKTC
jgi:hypothetical protein